MPNKSLDNCLEPFIPPYIEPHLYYWSRDQKGSSAELDYIIEHKNSIVPIEVKSGRTGSLKSLHLFMGAKMLPFAIRVNSDYPSLVDVNVLDSTQQSVSYRLLSLPFYLISEIRRLIDEVG